MGSSSHAKLQSLLLHHHASIDKSTHQSFLPYFLPLPLPKREANRINHYHFTACLLFHWREFPRVNSDPESPVKLSIGATKMSKTKAIALMGEIPAVVVSAGHMQKTVKVRVSVKQLNQPIKNYSSRQQTQLVHDPNNSLRIGDIIAISGGSWVSKDVHYTVDRIIVPFGPPIEERPPVPTIMERLAAKAEKRRLKQERQKEKLSKKIRSASKHRKDLDGVEHKLED